MAQVKAHTRKTKRGQVRVRPHSRKLKTFVVQAWIHPIKGGDDEQVELTMDAFTKEGAEHLTRAWLKKRSDITNDFTLTEIPSKQKTIFEDSVIRKKWGDETPITLNGKKFLVRKSSGHPDYFLVPYSDKNRGEQDYYPEGWFYLDKTIKNGKTQWEVPKRWLKSID